MGDVDDDHVGTGPDEFLRPLEVVPSRPDRGGHPEPSLVVAGRERQVLLTQQVLGGDEARESPVGVGEWQLLELVTSHQLRRSLRRRHALVHHQPLPGRHALGHRRAQIRKPEVPLRQQPCEASLVVGDHQRPDVGALHQRSGCLERRVRGNRVRVADDRVLTALDDRHLVHLRRNVPVAIAAVDDAEAAFLGEHDRHLGTRHGVHVGRDDRVAHGNVLRESSAEIDSARIPAFHDRLLRSEQEVVERAATHHGLEGVHRLRLSPDSPRRNCGLPHRPR